MGRFILRWSICRECCCYTIDIFIVKFYKSLKRRRECRQWARHWLLSDLCTLPVKRKRVQGFNSTCTAASSIQISRPNDLFHRLTVVMVILYCAVQLLYFQSAFSLPGGIGLFLNGIFPLELECNFVCTDHIFEANKKTTLISFKWRVHYVIVFMSFGNQ